MTIDALIEELIAAKNRGIKDVVATWTFVSPTQLPDWDSLNYKEQRTVVALLAMHANNANKNFAATQQEIQKQLHVKKPNHSHPGVFRVLRELERTHNLLNSYQTTNTNSHKRVYFLTPVAVSAYKNKKITAAKSSPTTKNPIW